MVLTVCGSRGPAFAGAVSITGRTGSMYAALVNPRESAMNRIKTIACFLGALLVLALTACGGGGKTTVGGTVSGLAAGTAVTMQNNGTDTLAVASNGSFTFSSELSDGDGYSVVILIQPAGATCTLTNASGTIDSNASKVTNIDVVCVPNHAVGGTVTGLGAGTSVTLLNNGTDALAVATNGSFTFPTLLGTGSSYNVTVSVQPVGKACTVAQGPGTVQSVDVTTVSIQCM